MISDRSIREYFKHERGIDLPKTKNPGSIFYDMTDEKLDFLLEHDHLNKEEFISLYKQTFGRD